jgi:chromosome segregation ATPase
MEQELLPEQKEFLLTWAGKRDAIASEVSVLRAQKEKLEIEIKQVAASYADIVNMTNQYTGRIAELKKREEDLLSLVSKDMVKLESQKTLLTAEITALKKAIVPLQEQKASLEKDVSLSLSTFNIVKNEGLLLDKVIDRVTSFSEKNTIQVNLLVANLKKGLQEMIDVNQKNITETNQVLDKLPKMLVELQKVKLIKNKI